MHDIKTLKATPGLARRLLMFSQMNHMLFDEKLVGLAMQGLIEPKDLEGLPFTIDNSQLGSLQFVQDWDGRAMVLCGTAARGREVAIANAWLKGGKTMVLAHPKFYGQWAQLIRDAFPDASISVFGNPRYHEKNVTFPSGIEFSEKPDFSADFFVTSYSGVIWHNLLNQVALDQTIVEELDNVGAINYKWDTAVKGIFHEIPAPLFIQDINNLPNDKGRDNIASLQATGSKAMEFIGSTVTNLLWAGITHMGILSNGTKLNEAETYLVGRGYTGVDNLKMLSLFGVSNHLLDDVQGHKKPIVFFDNTLNDALGDRLRNQNSGLMQTYERERSLERTTGRPIADVVEDALQGDRPSETLIGALQTPQWANLKARHLHSTHGNLANRMSRCLFLTEHRDLKRALLLNFGFQLEDLSQSKDRVLSMARFLNPHITVPLTAEQWRGMRPLSNLIVTIDDLIQEPNLLQVSNFLFLAEAPMSQDYLDAVRAAAAASGTRIVRSVIRSTFEEHIYKQLR